METETITLHVAPDVARVFKALPHAQQRKLEALLSLHLLEWTQENESLEEVMRATSRNAQARGLTPEILAEILDEA